MAYSGTETGNYNKLWVAGTDNKASALEYFNDMTFDITDRSDEDVMMELTSTNSAHDLTSVSSIGITEGDESVAADPGDILYLIKTESGISVTASSIGTVSSLSYELPEDLVSDGASLKGTYDREIMVIDSEGEEVSADDNGILEGTDLVLSMSNVIDVMEVDFALSSESKDESVSLEWGDDNTKRITLEDSSETGIVYSFSIATFSGLGSLEITGDAVSGTLLHDGQTTLLLDGSSSTVTGLDEDVLSAVTATVTYEPVDNVTVTGTSSLAAVASEDSGDVDSIALSSTSIDSVTFSGEIEYVDYASGDALIKLTEGNTYNMSETEFDVSELTLVDDGITVTDTDGEELIVMTLIDADGAYTYLGSNEIADASQATSDTIGYELPGTGSSVLKGEVDAVVSVSAEDDDPEGMNADLVLNADTYVTVSSVAFDETDTVTWGDSTQITLNSELTYAFSADTEVTGLASSTAIDVIDNTLLAEGDTSVLLDGSGSTVDGIKDVTTLSGEYSYVPADGVTVTGSLTLGASDENADDSEDSLSLTITSIDTIEFGDITYSDEALVELDSEKSYDLSSTEVIVDDMTLVDENGDSVEVTYEDGDEMIVMTLIETNGVDAGLTTSQEMEDLLTINYTLTGTDEDGDSNGSSLSGTLPAEVGVSDYDLVIKAGTAVTVSSVDLDLTSLEWDGDALLTLNEDLSYDFTTASLSLTDAVITTSGFLDVDSTTVLIDGESSTVTDLSALADEMNSYSYSLLDGVVSVTGTGTTVSSGSSLDYSISSIDTMDFTISSDTDTSSAILTVTTADLSGTEITVTASVESGTDLSDGYSVTLVESTQDNGITTDDETSYSGTLIEGVSVEYELEFDADGTEIVASYTPEEDDGTSDDPDTTDGTTSTDNTDDTDGTASAAASLRDETKSLVETRLAQSAMIDQGQELVAGILDSELDFTRGKKTWVPFVIMSASAYQYDTGSHIDIDGFNSAVGLLRNIYHADGKSTVGAAFQYGRGEYDSYAEGVDASGDADYVGGVVMARRCWNSGMYVEGSVSAGYSQADYSSDSILEGSVTTYDIGSKYWGAHLGVGREIRYGGNSSLNVYGKMFYSHLNSSNARLSSGETYSFDDVDSTRLRIGARFTRMAGDNLGYYFGAAYQYQFDDETRASYSGMSTLTPSLQGSSGMMEAGLKLTPKDMDSLTVDLGVTGFVGKQKGIEGALKLKWDI